ncbi:NADH:flavin oxidoreductase [Acinetobacter pittii]|uniref:NADH:flavin oxidoreductase n=1 Tax=Acinetobacter pittii TaxID=48296 RepID=UPI003260707A
MKDLIFPSSFTLKTGLRVKNRIFLSSIGLDLADEDGKCSVELVDFYKKIIDGSVGMVKIGNATVSSSSRLHKRGLGLFTLEHVNALKPIIDYGNEKNSLIVIQLQHYGAQGSSQYTSSPLLSPSGKSCSRMMNKFPHDQVIEMTTNDIENVINEFIYAAWLVYQAGGKAIQIQAANGYLISSFLSPYTNQRTDEYGGSPQKRGLILKKIIEGINIKTKGKLHIFVRLGIDDGFDNDIGQKPEYLQSLIKELENLNVSGIECSICIGETFHKFLQGFNLKIKQRLFAGARTIKSYTKKIPVGCTGLVTSIEDAENLLKEYNLDYIGMARALFADPQLLNKFYQKIPVNHCKFEGFCFRDKSNPILDRVYCCVNPDYLRNSEIKYEI